jgi:hypothetical protein
MNIQAIMNGSFSSLLVLILLGAVVDALALPSGAIVPAPVASAVVALIYIGGFAFGYWITARRPARAN